MAVGADRAFDIVFLYDRFALKRICIGFKLLGVASLTTSLCNAQAPLVIFGRVFCRNIEAVGVVTTIASGVGLVRKILVLLGVERLLISLNVLHNQFEPGFVGGLARGLRCFP